MAQVIGNPELIRRTNQGLILEIIRQSGLISRADLAKTLQLSAPTVSANIERLLKRNVLSEVGSGDSSGGRPPILLKLNPDYGFMAGVDLSSDRVRIALVDFTGEIMSQKTISAGGGEEILQTSVKKIYSLIQDLGLETNKLLNVAIATPGVLDRNSKKLHLVPQFTEWEGLAIVDLVESAFSCPVLIRNDINTATLGEIQYGAGVGFQSLAYISVDTGVGAGIVLNGQLLEGVHSAAGEIGHMINDPGMIRPRKQGLGTLEAVAAVPFILEEAAKVMSFTSDDSLNKLSEMEQEIAKGNVNALQIMEKAARMIGYAIVNLHAVLDLETVIIGGSVTTFGERYLQIVRETVRGLAPLPLGIVYSKLAGLSVLKGAFVVAQEKAIEDIVNEG